MNADKTPILPDDDNPSPFHLHFGSPSEEKIRVWLRPLGDNCRVRVDGIDNVPFVLDHLRLAFEFDSIHTVELPGSSHCTFLIRSQPPLAPERVTTLLADIPEIELMLEPA